MHYLSAAPPIAPGSEKPLPGGSARAADGQRDLVALLSAARRGDELAWSRLVNRLDHVPRAVARSFRLTPTDAEDVVQSTWLQLFRHIDQIREPAAVPGWLGTVARREALRLLQRPWRERLIDDPGVGDAIDSRGPEDELLAAERHETLARALATLPERHRSLMTLVASASAPDYRQISEALAIPIGSIGPIRARSLARLGRHPELRCLCA